MSPDQQDPNPYASPQASTEPKARATPKGFQWRVIPAWLLLILGGMMILLSIAMAVQWGEVVIKMGTVEFLKNPFRLPVTIPIGVFTLSGSVCIYSALDWWKRRWLRAILTTLLGCGTPAGYIYWLN